MDKQTDRLAYNVSCIASGIYGCNVNNNSNNYNTDNTNDNDNGSKNATATAVQLKWYRQQHSNKYADYNSNINNNNYHTVDWFHVMWLGNSRSVSSRTDL